MKHYVRPRDVVDLKPTKAQTESGEPAATRWSTTRRSATVGRDGSQGGTG